MENSHGLHSQLARQLKRLKLDTSTPPNAEQWETFVRRVNQAYLSADQDKFHLERSLVVSSREMQELYDNLAKASETELAHERDKLAAVVHAFADALLAFTADGKQLLFSNPAARQLFRMSEDQMQAQVVLTRIQPRAEHTKSLLELAASGASVIDYEGNLEVDQRTIPVVCSLAPIREAGEVVGYVFAARDETERQRTRAELARALDEAREAVTAKSHFLANMSHEIRTPMNGVIGMIGLLLETKLNEDQREFATTVKSSAEALLTIINDILDFSKLEAGKVELEAIDFDLRQCVEEVADLLAPKADQKNLCFGTLIHRNVPRWVTGDPGRIRQVLLNLAGNAIKFTSKGEVLILCEPKEGRLRFAVRDTGIGIPADRIDRLFQSFTQVDASTTRKFGGTGLGLAICDQLVDAMGGKIVVSSEEGHGSTFFFELDLAEAKAPDAEELAQLSETLVLILDPAGVQADICHEHIATFGADMIHATTLEEAAAAKNVDVCLFVHRSVEESRLVAKRLSRRTKLVMLVPIGLRNDVDVMLEAGVDRSILLPVRHGPLQRVLRGLVAKPSRFGVASSLAPAPAESLAPVARRVLVVEDNKVNQMVARKMLEKLGCEVEVANNGREGLERATAETFDLVLMDCQMPEMDGYEATAAIRESEGGASETLIIALTANAAPGDVQKCLGAGMDDYLAKPITLDALKEKLGADPPATAA